MRLVYYALVCGQDDRYIAQWIHSVRSLRRYNSSVAVHLILFNSLPDVIREEAARWNVTIQFLGEYWEYLYRLHVRGPVLAKLSPVPKLLAMRHLPPAGVSQVLYLDCDTYFFDDVGILFEQYRECDWYGREEPTSRLSYHEYDPAHVDEDKLREIAESEGLSPVTPFNTGVCLLNHGIWWELARLRITFLDNSWRLAAGRFLHVERNPENQSESESGVGEALNELDRSRALPYPSQNFWIIEQIAFWLTLGRLAGRSGGFFAADHVAQNGEFPPAEHFPLVAAHYFSANEERFFDELRMRS
jgi:hypothetical protein